MEKLGLLLFCTLFCFLSTSLQGNAAYTPWTRIDLQGATGQVTNRCRWTGEPPLCGYYPQMGCTSAEFPVGITRAGPSARFYPVGLVPDEADCKFLGKYLCCPPSMARANCHTIIHAETYCTPDEMWNNSNPDCTRFEFLTPPDGWERLGLWYESEDERGGTYYTYYTEWCEVK